MNRALGMRPHLSQLVIWSLIYIGCRRTYQTLPDDGPPTQIASVFSFLPDAVLTNPTVFQSLHWLLLVAGILWSLHYFTPWSSWLTAISFTAVVAFYYENSAHIAHTYNLAVLVMLIHAAFYHFRHREIRTAIAHGVYWRSKLYPAWVFQLCVLSIALFHTYAGLSKLYASGWGWANGLSLQLWVDLWGLESELKTFILSNRTAAMALQVGTLMLETGALLALLSKRWRWAIGFGLMGLYAGIQTTFNFSFQYNALLVALFFLPTYTALNWLFEKIQSRSRIRLSFRKQHFGYRLVFHVLSRIDILSVFELRIIHEATSQQDEGFQGPVARLEKRQR